MMAKKWFIPVLIAILLMGCAGIPVREEVKVDLSLPVGKIEGNRFTGIRYPFNVSAPSNWKVTTEIPSFMEELGYERPGLEESQVFIYNPATRSNIQIEFTPAGRHARFNQETIDWLTNAGTGSLKSELEKEHGKPIKVEVSPTEHVSLKGVQFAAKKYVTYSLKGVNREQGWIYGFTEPYQIFILYMILDGESDRKDMKTILDTFEATPKK